MHTTFEEFLTKNLCVQLLRQLLELSPFLPE